MQQLETRQINGGIWYQLFGSRTNLGGAGQYRGGGAKEPPVGFGEIVKVFHKRKRDRGKKSGQRYAMSVLGADFRAAQAPENFTSGSDDFVIKITKVCFWSKRF